MPRQRKHSSAERDRSSTPGTSRMCYGLATDMNRRDFMSLVGGAAAVWPLTARAQAPALPLVGFIHNGSPGAYMTRMSAAFSETLKVAGYVAGQNLTIEYRWAEGHNDRLPALAAEFIDRKAAAILAAGGPAPGRAAMAETT